MERHDCKDRQGTINRTDLILCERFSFAPAVSDSELLAATADALAALLEG